MCLSQRVKILFSMVFVHKPLVGIHINTWHYTEVEHKNEPKKACDTTIEKDEFGNKISESIM